MTPYSSIGESVDRWSGAPSGLCLFQSIDTDIRTIQSPIWELMDEPDSKILELFNIDISMEKERRVISYVMKTSDVSIRSYDLTSTFVDTLSCEVVPLLKSEIVRSKSLKRWSRPHISWMGYFWRTFGTHVLTKASFGGYRHFYITRDVFTDKRASVCSDIQHALSDDTKVQDPDISIHTSLRPSLLILEDVTLNKIAQHNGEWKEEIQQHPCILPSQEISLVPIINFVYFEDEEIRNMLQSSLDNYLRCGAEKTSIWKYAT